MKLPATVQSPTPKLVDIRLTSSGLFTFDAALLTGFAGQFPPAPVYALAATQLNPTEAAIVDRLDVWCLAAYHDPRTISHLAGLPANVLSDLFFRRFPMSTYKLQNLPATTNAPLQLKNGVPRASLEWALANAKRNSHGGHLPAAPTRIGEVTHVDLYGPSPTASPEGYS
jgi:hypothetical protein